MADLLIRNGTLITMDEKRRIIENGAVAVTDGKIVAIGKTEEIEKEYKADKVINANKNVIMPGLVNTHTHLFQTLGKGLGTDVDLLGWFKAAWAPLVEGMTDEDYYNAVMLGALEAIKSGTTTLLGYEHALNAHPTAITLVIEALKKSGIRALLGIGYQDTGREIGAPEIALRETDEIIKYLKDSFKRYHNTNEGRLKIWLAPGTVNWCTDELLQATKDFAEEYKTGITIHMNETRAEYEYSRKHRGVGEIGYVYQKGLLGANVLGVHTVWPDDSEIQLMAKYDVKVSHNPLSNMYLASGVAPIPKLLKAGITVGLATDGATSNNNNDMFDVIRVTPLLHKVATLDPLALTAEKTLEMATIDGARAVLLEKEIGSLEVGKKADIIIVDMRLPNVAPVIYAPAALVYSAGGENVLTTIVDGQILMENRKVLVMNEKEVIKAAEKSVENILKRSGSRQKRLPKQLNIL